MDTKLTTTFTSSIPVRVDITPRPSVVPNPGHEAVMGDVPEEPPAAGQAAAARLFKPN